MTPTEGALELASLGFRIFPLRHDTKAGHIVRSWKSAATSDLARIKQWGSVGHNFGVWARGHIILDVDTAEGAPGLESLTELMFDRGLPNTRTHESARGGLHLFYALPPGVEVSNRDKPLGDGINVRGVGGYVVAPGSTFEGRPYVVKNRLPIAMAPEWLIDVLKAATAREETEAPANLVLDTQAAISEAERWLQAHEAPKVGARGSTTYKAACHLRDLGVSQHAALVLIDAHFVARFDPPYGTGEDTTPAEVEHAYRYAQNAPGSKSVEAYFEPFNEGDIPDPSASENLSSFFRPLATNTKSEDIARRQWIIPGLLLRRYMTLLVSPPGVGKSSLVLAYAMAVALGANSEAGKRFAEALGISVAEQTRVLMINMEDDEEELLRRFHAICEHHKLDPTLFEGWLHIVNDNIDPFKAVRRGSKGVLVEGDLVQLETYISQHKIGFVSADPLVEIHEGDENSNADAAFLMKRLRAMLRRTNAALLLVHHTRKPPMAATDGYAGNMDAGRGASAYGGAARVAYTLFGMSGDEASLYGVPQDQRHRYVRLDNSKASYTSRGKLCWYQHITVTLGNGEAANALTRVELGPLADAENKRIIEVLLPIVREAGKSGLLLTRAREHLSGDFEFSADKRTSKQVEAIIIRAVASGLSVGGRTLAIEDVKDGARVSRRLFEKEAD